ncbi:MAG: GGDEF domain-containing protein [Syntrophorhabdaceae bacterium]|nr:GGDEF domain-containing protein [Syntrophorhabdaceae bacterium]
MNREKFWQDRATKLKREMSYLLTHDAITELPNRVLFYDRLEMAITHSHRNKERFALFILDIDDFKDVIHQRGYVFGDEVLREAGLRLKKSVRKGDTVARFGGDEFALILNSIIKKENVIKVAKGIMEFFHRPFVLNDSEEVSVTASMGIAIFPEHGIGADELIKNADIALSFAKEIGKDNFMFFSYQIKDVQGKPPFNGESQDEF